MTKGFSNWKDATIAFKKHVQSKCHAEAVKVVVTLPKTTKDVGEQLSRAHRMEKEQARDMLRLILSSVRFLARQGLGLRGDGSDASGNLIQLLRLRGEDKPQVIQWLEKNARKHTAPENQNEMLQLMAHHVLRRVLKDIHSSPFLAVMVDETRDMSNIEQLTFVLRWVSEDFTVSEEFLGLYCLSSVDAQSIVDVMTDAFLRFQIPLTKLRGQCYDGCSTMAGAKAGVAAKIAGMEPRAVFTHCYGHALSLSISDTIKRSSAMKDCLDTSWELVKLIKFSPKREAMLRELKEETGSDAPGVRTLCPTRWTVRAGSLASIVANYDNIQLLWETAVCATSDTEMKARIQGVASQMQTFRFLFCLLLSEMILRHADKLSQTLQQPKLSSIEAHGVAMLTVKTLETLRTDDNFDLFWQKVVMTKEQVDVDEPQLPRRRKLPRRFEQGNAPAEFAVSPKDEYRRVYFEALDLAVTSICSRFDQKGFKTFCTVEQLPFKACGGQCFTEELDVVCSFFYDDFTREDLEAELSTLHNLYHSVSGEEVPSVDSIKTALLSLSTNQRTLLSSVCRLFQLLMILPAMNATSERSLSALQRIKSYLRNRMTQARLNHLMILHYHQDMTDSLDLKCIANEYITKNEARKSTFATF